MIEKKAPPTFTVRPMSGPEETWEIDGVQHGTPYKDKMYRRIK